MKDQKNSSKTIPNIRVHFFSLFIFHFSFFLLSSGSISAQGPGSLDPGFNGTGYVVYDRDQLDLYQDVKVQPDGKVVAVGTSYTPTYSSVIEVTRYLDDGSFDPAFGTSGHYNFGLNVETGAYKCIIRDNGKILVGGYTTDYATWSLLLLQLNSDGNPDASFGNNGVVLLSPGPGENIIFAIALLSDGQILASGYAQDASFMNVPFVARFSETGVLDTSFGTDGFAKVAVTQTDNDFSAVCVQSDGKIIAAGHISNGINWFSLLIARFDKDGKPDESYGTSGVVNLNLGNVDDEFFDMTVTSQDDAILTGFSVTQGDYYYHMLLMKFDASGHPVNTFGNNGSVISGDLAYTVGDALVLETDGRILVTGCTGSLQPENNDWALWRFNGDGSPDTTFGTNGLTTTDFFGNPDESLGIALYQDKIILAGKTRNEAILNDFAVARYTNDVGVSVPYRKETGEIVVSPNPARPGQTVTLSSGTTAGKNTMRVDLFNSIGINVSACTKTINEPGRQAIRIDLPAGLSPGLYSLRITLPGCSPVTRKLVVQ